MTTNIVRSPIAQARHQLASTVGGLFNASTNLDPNSVEAQQLQSRLAEIQKMDQTLAAQQAKFYKENPMAQITDALADLQERMNGVPGISTNAPNFSTLEPESTGAQQAQLKQALQIQLSTLEPESPQAQMLQQRLQGLDTLNRPASQPGRQFNAAW